MYKMYNTADDNIILFPLFLNSFHVSLQLFSIVHVKDNTMLTVFNHYLKLKQFIFNMLLSKQIQVVMWNPYQSILATKLYIINLSEGWNTQLRKLDDATNPMGLILLM